MKKKMTSLQDQIEQQDRIIQAQSREIEEQKKELEILRSKENFLKFEKPTSEIEYDEEGETKKTWRTIKEPKNNYKLVLRNSYSCLRRTSNKSRYRFFVEQT
jgi:hypothetical protein